ncbi:MAG: phosphotransferase [Candidatus Protochlamydia sp.]|nr:phosphotransferase [Candidatus Protochlamydia sp.]
MISQTNLVNLNGTVLSPPAPEPVFTLNALSFFIFNFLSVGIYGAVQGALKERSIKCLKFQQENLINTTTSLLEKYQKLESKISGLKEKVLQEDLINLQNIDELQAKAAALESKYEGFLNSQTQLIQSIALSCIRMIGKLLCNVFTIGLYGVYQNHLQSLEIEKTKLNNQRLREEARELFESYSSRLQLEIQEIIFVDRAKNEPKNFETEETATIDKVMNEQTQIFNNENDAAVDNAKEEQKQIFNNETDKTSNNGKAKLTATKQCDKQIVEEFLPDNRYFQYLKEEDKLPRSQQPLNGMTANVTFFNSNQHFKDIAPYGIVKKEYFGTNNAADDKNLWSFFDNEVMTLKALNKKNGVLKLIAYDEDKRIILMSRVPGQNVLTDLNNNPSNFQSEKTIRNFVKTLVKLHKMTPRLGMRYFENAKLYSLKELESTIDPWIEISREYIETINRIDNQEIQNNIKMQLDAFLNAVIPQKFWLARCHNDPSFQSFYPESKIFIDYGASYQSPVQRDLAAAIAHSYFTLTELNATQSIWEKDYIGTTFKNMIAYYEEEFKLSDHEFEMDYNQLRWFIPLYLIKNSLFVEDKETKDSLYKKCLELLKPQQQSGSDEIIDILMTK